MESKAANPLLCSECDAMVMDALDGALSSDAQTAFDRHLSTCAVCSRRVADAQRGAAWLEMLKSPRPEPSADLMARILAQTSGSHIPALVPAQPAIALPHANIHANILPFRPRRPVASTPLRTLLFQPRLAMTAAMAFFSVALTMNLIGFHPTQIKASQLSPSSLVRDLYQTTAHVAQYYDNLRVVSQFESQLQQLEQTTNPGSSNDQTAPQNTPQKQPAPGNGSSRRDLPASTQISRNGIRSTRQGVSA